MLSPPSLLLMRSIEYFEDGHWALINPPDAAIFNEIGNPNLVGLHQYYHQYEKCLSLNGENEQHFAPAFYHQHIGDTLLDGIVIYMPKSKQQLAMLIDNASHLINPGSPILVVGENKAGIKSVSKLLEKIGSPVNKVDSAKHCGLYAVTVEQTKASFSIDNYGLVNTYTIHDHSVQVFSLPGVFGHKQLDPGTELLLQQLSPKALEKTAGHIYDFACGTGIIGNYLALELQSNNISLSMSDVSALAIYCANKTSELNSIKPSSLKIQANDGVLRSGERFDVVVSNPPFHEGMQNDYTITERFIQDAFRHSNQYANMTIVANKFLPYPDIFDTVYKGFTEVAASNKYRVYAATKFSKS